MRTWSLILLASCAAQPFETPVELPRAEHGTDADLTGARRIHLTHEGAVLVDGEELSLDALAARLPPDEPPPLLCIDRRAPVAHAVWLLATLGDRPAWIGVEDRGRLRVLAVPDEGKVRENSWLTPDEGGRPQILVDLEDWDEGPVCRVPVLESGEWVLALVKLDLLRGSVRAFCGAIEREPFAVVSADSHFPFQTLVTVVDALHAEGVRDAIWPRVPPHAWMRAQPRLPPPAHRQPMGNYDSSWKDAPSLALPLAPAGIEDRDDDPDDRVILNLDRHGQILYKSRRITLDELSTVLDKASRLYDLKMRAADKSGRDEEGWSRLFVLLRGDRDAPWQHVQWMLAVLREQRFSKIQLAVMRVADVRYTAEEARTLGAERGPRQPPPDGVLEWKLPCPLPKQALSSARAASIRPVRETLGDWGEHRVPVPTEVAYGVDGRETADVRGLAGLVAEGDAVLLDPLPNVPWKFVVAAVNALRAGGAAEIDFAPGPPPSEPQRRLELLPYPGHPNAFALPYEPADEPEWPEERPQPR